MGHPARRHPRRAAPTAPRHGDGAQPGSPPRSLNERRTAHPRRVGRPDLAQLLGRPVDGPLARDVLTAYDLHPAPVTGLKAKPRTYISVNTGVELTTGHHGTITAITLHFHGRGLTPFHGELPAGAGTIPRRTALRRTLGFPDLETPTTDTWLLLTLTLQATYEPDHERLARATLTLPTHLPRRLTPAHE
jgi:hypothetical protein